ncbi:MAG: hypothetical protein KDC85_18995 [Saprospiraceae bacterium]|nr:hypothetical protein [Saprospiraceae bacterium]MCB9326947.1 hypothetical protein [Lewinellaceae bacterium]
MNSKQFIVAIRQKIAGDEIQDAITALQVLLANSPKLNEILIQSARHTDIMKHIRLGTVDFEQANVTKNQIRLALLDLLSEVEKQEATPAIQQEMEQAISIVNSKNVVSGSTITAGGNVHIGDKNITQNADKIINIDKIDNANFY